MTLMTSNLGFKVTVLFEGEYLKIAHFREKVNTERY